MTTNENILKKAVKKAIENGLKLPFSNIDIDWYVASYSMNDIIFSHDFAKAFWGDKILRQEYIGGEYDCIPAWKFHLQQMVLEEEPLKYLERFL